MFLIQRIKPYLSILVNSSKHMVPERQRISCVACVDKLLGLRACMAWINKYSNRKANCERQLIQEGNLCKRERDVCSVCLTSPPLVRECPPHAAQHCQCQEQSAGALGSHSSPSLSLMHCRATRSCATVPFPSCTGGQDKWVATSLLHSTLP